MNASATAFGGYDGQFLRVTDLEDPIPALKEQLRQAIVIELSHVKQNIACGALGIDQPRMSDLMQGKLDRFSLEKLIRLLHIINRRVDLKITAVGPVRIFRICRNQRIAGGS